MRRELASVGLLQIQDGNRQRRGANQEWYRQTWQRRAGCGPTACAHLLWYLSRTREGCRPLCAHDGSTRAGFVRLMEDVWQYVTPGMMGLNRTNMLAEGAAAYGAARGVDLTCRVLDVSAAPGARPDEDRLGDFLDRALADDLPVAFLNLSNGSLRNLEGWHWVTLTALDRARMRATMYDQGGSTEIDVGLWLSTTALGGGFVAVEPAG